MGFRLCYPVVSDHQASRFYPTPTDDLHSQDLENDTGGADTLAFEWLQSAVALDA